MSIKNVLRKGLSLFAEFPEDEAAASPVSTYTAPTPAPRTVEEIVASTPGPKLEEINLGTEPAPAVPAPGGAPDFNAVYQRAGLPVVPFTAEQALEVIHSLPADLPIDVRRKTVQATLQTMGKAMGVGTDAVLSDATRKLAALAAYEDLLKGQTEAYCTKVQGQIADLERQIAEHKTDIDNTRLMLESATKSCTDESERLDDVIEFFTQDVGASKYAGGGPTEQA